MPDRVPAVVPSLSANTHLLGLHYLAIGLYWLSQMTGDRYFRSCPISAASVRKWLNRPKFDWIALCEVPTENNQPGVKFETYGKEFGSAHMTTDAETRAVVIVSKRY